MLNHPGMKTQDLYALCGAILPLGLELGIFRLYAVGTLGTAAAHSAAFAIAAITIAAIMLRDTRSGDLRSISSAEQPG